MLPVDLERVTLILRMAFLPSLWKCLFSSVVEHQSRKLGVVGSNPTGGNHYFAPVTPCPLLGASKKHIAVGRVRTYAGRAHWISSPTP
jgi:hypothetical protein